MQTSLIEVLKIRKSKKCFFPKLITFSLKWLVIVKIFIILSNKNLILLMKIDFYRIFRGPSLKESITLQTEVYTSECIIITSDLALNTCYWNNRHCNK